MIKLIKSFTKYIRNHIISDLLIISLIFTILNSSIYAYIQPNKIIYNYANDSIIIIHMFIINIIYYIFTLILYKLVYIIYHYKQYERFINTFFYSLCIMFGLNYIFNEPPSIPNIINYIIFFITQAYPIIYIIIYFNDRYNKVHNKNDIPMTIKEKHISKGLLGIIYFGLCYILHFVNIYNVKINNAHILKVINSINYKKFRNSKSLIIKILKLKRKYNQFCMHLEKITIMHFAIYFIIIAFSILIFIIMLSHYFIKKYKYIFEHKSILYLYGNAIIGNLTVFGTMIGSLYLLNPYNIIGDNIIFLYNYLLCPIFFVGLWLNLEKTFINEIRSYNSSKD